jgi:hypothetical protein
MSKKSIFMYVLDLPLDRDLDVFLSRFLLFGIPLHRIFVMRVGIFNKICSK